MLLEERARWNDEIKVYTARVSTYEQAVMILEAMRLVSPRCPLRTRKTLLMLRSTR